MSLENMSKQTSEGQEGALSKLRRKTKGLAKALVFTTALSVGCDNLSNQRKNVEVKENISEAVQLITEDSQERARLTKLLLEHPYSAMTVCSILIPKLSNPELFFKIAARRASKAAVLYAPDYKSLFNSDEILQEAALNLLKQNKAASLIEQYHRYSDYPSAEKILEMGERNISDQESQVVFVHARYLDGKDYAQEVCDRIFKNDPPSAIEFASQSQNQRDILAPHSGGFGNVDLKVRENNKVIAAALKNSQDSSVKAINDLNETRYSVETKKKMSLLLQNVLDKKTTFEEMAEIVEDDLRMLSALLDVNAQPNPLGKMVIQKELKNRCLEKVYQLNMLHNETDALRFKLVEGMGSRELYSLITYGEDEVYTSSFNGIFDRMLKDMEEKKISGDQLIETVKYNKFRTFIKMCAAFNRLNDFLRIMKPESAENLLKKFVQNIESAPDMLSQAVAVADTFGSLEDPAIMGILQKEIISEYHRLQKEGNLKGETLYGLLAGIFEGKIVIDDNWLREVAKKYKLPNLDKVSSSELFNPDGTNIQQYFFYNDTDGRGSFENFISQYKDKSDWKIEQKGSYVFIRSVAGKNKKKIEIYANFPDKEKEGPIEIEKELKKKNIQSIIVVHRGHSFHAQETIERIPNIAKIVSLGSCGGYNNLREVLRKAPGAHIISTKGTGTRHVNDPLFKMLNMEILNGRDIEWNKFWIEAENKLGNNKDFKSYVPPNKNLGVLFIKAYNSIIKKRNK